MITENNLDSLFERLKVVAHSLPPPRQIPKSESELLLFAIQMIGKETVERQEMTVTLSPEVTNMDFEMIQKRAIFDVYFAVRAKYDEIALNERYQKAAAEVADELELLYQKIIRDISDSTWREKRKKEMECVLS